MNTPKRILFGTLMIVAPITGLAARPAAAQSLPGFFQRFDPPYVNPSNPNDPGLLVVGTNLEVDRDGDGIREATYPIPVDLQTALTLRLTPTRDIVYAVIGSCSGGTQVQFYQLPDTSGNPPSLMTTVCVQPGVAHYGFYDTGISPDPPGLDLPTPDALLGVSTQRIAYIATDNPPPDPQNIIWVDMDTGATGTASFNYNRIVDVVKVAPSGTHALVRHGVLGGQDPDYTFVSLCPGELGTVLTGQAGLFDIPGNPLDAEVINVASGLFDIDVTQDGNPISFLQDVPDCLAPPPDPIGACCVGLGCIPDLTEADCDSFSGFWQGAGSTCDACPLMRLQIAKSGPASIYEGGPVTYTLSYENTGNQVATNVQITDPIPAGSTFDSADNDGTLASGIVTWQMGTLNPGDTGSVTLTVLADCGTTSLTNTNYRIRTGFYAWGGPDVNTTVIPASSDPVDVSIASIPQNNPLNRGDQIHHHITLTNSVAQPRNGIRFIVDFGFASDFGAVIDDAGGNIEFLGITRLEWTGPVPPSGSSTIQFTTTVKECTLVPQEQLNRGNQIQVKNGCGVVVGTGLPPGPFPIQRPTSSSLVALNLGPPQFLFDEDTAIQVARPGGAIDFQITLTNLLSTDQTVAGSLQIPPELTPVGNPPFIPPTDPAATYDDPTRTISWSGIIPGNSEIKITYRATLNATGCSVQTSFSGGTGTCTNDLDTSALLLLVPEPPVESHLIGINGISGPPGSPSLRTFRPGIDTGPQTLICLPAEILFGLDRASNGDIWVAGVPTFRLNPDTLDFEIFPEDFASNTLGITPLGLLSDVAVDPSDNTVIFVGSNWDWPNISVGAIRRYDPATSLATPILDDAGIEGIRRVVIDPEGMIAAAVDFQKVVRIDPADPTNFQTFTDPTVPFPSSLALDLDGDYIVSDFAFGMAPRLLAKIDRATGAFSTIVPDLNALVPTGNPFQGCAVGTDGRIYLGPEFGSSIMVYRSPAIFGWGVPVMNAVDMVFVEGIASSGNPDLDDDGDVDTDDFMIFVGCFRGSLNPPDPTTCQNINADLDGDGDVDAFDFLTFSNCFNGSNNPPQCPPVAL